LHIAAGYLHEKVIATLMNAGADPSLEDNSGRSPLTLVETLLRNTPATTALFSKRLALEAVSTSLRNFMFEEVVPEAISQKRVYNSRVQFLVTWSDGMRIVVYSTEII
jgi:signal recognition particle protein